MQSFERILSGGDLRSIGKSNLVVLKVTNQTHFDDLFKCLFYDDRIVVMRAADAIEKITTNNPGYLRKHKKEIFALCKIFADEELKWHLALLIPRLQLDNKEFNAAWNILTAWAKDRSNSRIVRVNSIQGLFNLCLQNIALKPELILLLSELKEENIPSINARIKKLSQSLKFQHKILKGL